MSIKCPPNPTGKMLIKPEIANSRKLNYLETKHMLLSKHIEKIETVYLYYSIKQLTILLEKIDMLLQDSQGNAIGIEKRVDGMRIYFANILTQPNNGIITYKGNQSYANNLSLIFSPTEKKEFPAESGNYIHANMKNYFHLDPLSDDILELNSHSAQAWINDYTKPGGKHELLSKNIIPAKTETKSVWISKEEVIDLICYMKNQQPVTGIFIYLGSYENGYTLPFYGDDVSNQLTITITLSRKKSVTLPTEFNKEKIANESFIIEDSDPDADTTVPCPPRSCDGSDDI